MLAKKINLFVTEFYFVIQEERLKIKELNIELYEYQNIKLDF